MEITADGARIVMVFADSTNNSNAVVGMITNNDNEERPLDITELPTDEYPALRENDFRFAQEGAEPNGADTPPAEAQGEPVRAASSLAQIEAEVSRLHGKWQSIETEFQKRETQIVLLHEEIRTRETAIAKLHADLEGAAIALKAAEERLDAKDATIAVLADERRASDERIAALAKNLADSEGIRADTIEKLARAQAEASRLNDLVRQEQTATTSVVNRNEQILAEQELLRGKLQDLEIYINGRHDRWSAVNAELAAQKDALREMSGNLKERDVIIAQHDEEKAQLAASIHELERQCSELAGRRKEREEAYDELQKKLGTHIAQAEQLKTEYASRTKELERAAQTALETEHRLESLEAIIKRRDEELHALNAEVEQSKLAVAALRAQMNATQEALDDKSRDAEQLLDERDAARKDYARVRTELDTLSAHAIELARLRGEAAVEIERLNFALAAQQELAAKQGTELRAKQATADMLERSVDRITDLGASLAALDQQMQAAPHPGDFGATVASDGQTGAAPPVASAPHDGEPPPIDLLLDAEPNHNVIDIGERTKIEAGRKLVVTIDGQVSVYPILKRHMTIGRGHESDIRIASHFVSRLHARIVTNSSSTTIEDVGSKNGVFVNSQRVLRRVLHDGDVVWLGDDSNLRFVDATH
jgi:chromosome segregation ATPase